MATMRAYWKRFAALGIAFAHKYRDDLFVRTEVNVIALQVAYALVIIAFSVGALYILYHDIVTGVTAAIATALTSTTPITESAILRALEEARTREIVGIAALIFSAAAIFGYLIARFALLPARNALEAQKRFIGNIAHEIRTPLSIIKTNLETRMLDTGASKAVREIDESNLEEIDRISGIINNLLSLNMLIRPEHIPFEDVDLAKIVNRVVEKLGPAIRKKSLHVEVRAARERVVHGNPVALEQVVLNILKNAVHYTHKGGVTVTIGPDGDDMIELSVRDTGVGIKRPDLFRVFEPFYRGDSARTRSGGAGSGLGLAIVGELVKIHHGRVSIRSAYGKGTNVLVALPAGEAARERRTSAPGKLENEVSVNFSTSPFDRRRQFHRRFTA